MPRGFSITLLAVSVASLLVAPGCANPKKVEGQLREQEAALGNLEAENQDLRQQLGKARAEMSRLEGQLRTAGSRSSQPVPEPTAAPPAERQLLLLDGHMFAPGRATLTGEAQMQLHSALGEFRSAARSSFLRIEGHTDDSPIRMTKKRYSSNFDLAGQRALSVLEYLRTTGRIDPSRLYIASFGSHRPVTDNDTAAGQARNRRVVIVSTNQ